MKKSLLALAVLGAFAGVASAQSSVTLFGTVDLAGTYVKNDGSAKRLSLTQDGINSSQLGFRGIEDLGGGLKAGFLLLSGVNADTGTANSKFWNRRATVSLFSNAGELRLGRDYTPTFWNLTIFDAFGTNGLGSSLNVRQLYGGTRQDNSVGYFLPSNLGGFYGQAMVAAAEGNTTADKNARYLGARIGFAAGPFDVSGAYSTQRFGLPSAGSSAQAGGRVFAIAAGESQKTYNVAGSYDFGFLKLMGYYDHESIPGANEKNFSLSTVIPFGQSEVHLGYDRSSMDNGTTTKVDQIKATYQYNLSKRTAMYGTISRLSNKDDLTRITLGAVPSSAGNALPTAGGQSKGFQVGLRHFF
ncbi:MAG: porin [Caldimonas sp.]